jgi:hypothetical protein
MIGLGITLTAITLVIIILRIKSEVERSRLSIKGGIIVGLAFALSLGAIVTVALLTSEGSLGIRLSVLAFCIAFVFSSYKFAKRQA